MKVGRKLRIVAVSWLFGVVASVNAFSPPNVILFLIEGVGADDVGFAESGLAETPEIDALAATGVVFTDWAVASISDEPTTATLGRMPQAFRRAGYETRFIGHGPVQAPAEAGFEVRSQTITSADQWLRAGRSDDLPFFLTVSFSGTAGFAKEAPDLVRFHRENGQSGSAEFLAGLAIIDARLKDIRTALRATGLSDNTILIFTSASARQGGKKPRGLWIDRLHVPLVLSWPKGIDGGRKISEPAWGRDLGATLSQLCGVKVAPVAGGVDLSPLLGGENLEARKIPFRWHGKADSKFQMVRKGRYLFLSENGARRIHDLNLDPELNRDLWDTTPDVRAQFADELR